MIDYKPENEYFNWSIQDNIPARHWHQLLRQVPYDVMALYFKLNPAIKYEIDQRINNGSSN